MFTLLIADDEPLAQAGLKSMLDWASLGVSIVGSSPNGAHALEAIKRLRPDIVIADVRMPIIDGITLIERCRAEMEAPPEFIVLSGHADFDYARRAIRSGVVDYLVKLELDEPSLRATVEKAMAAVAAKRAGLPPAAAVQAAQATPFAEAVFARFLTSSAPAGTATQAGTPAASEAPAPAETPAASGTAAPAGGGRGGAAVPAELAASFAGGLHCAAVFSVDYQHGERLSEEERERTYRCVADTVRQVAGREAAVRIAPLGPARFAVSLSFEAAGLAPEAAEAAAYAAVERAREPAERYFAVGLTAGIGAAVADLALLPDSYRGAERALESADALRPVVRHAGRGPASAGSLRSVADSEAMERIVADLIRAAETRQAELVVSSLDAAIAELESEAVSPAETLAVCCDLLYAILGVLEGAAGLLDSCFPDEAAGYRSLFSAEDGAAMRDWLRSVRDGLAARFAGDRARGRNPLVVGVREYVTARWAEKISLPEVAAHFHVSPNHLSSIFKKYNGTGFVEFVASVKMEKAKELIVAGRYKMYEIAQLLAYEDAYYFSKVFKRATGMSPREYHLRYAVMGGGMASAEGQTSNLPE